MIMLFASFNEISAAQPTSRLIDIPLQFEPNAGQAPQGVEFVSRSPGYMTFVSSTQTVFSFRSSDKVEQPNDKPRTKFVTQGLSQGWTQRTGASPWASWSMSLVGGNTGAAVESAEPLPGTVSYFHGADPRGWHAGLKTFAKVVCRQVYPGVDVVYYGNQRKMECDFVVAPYADPSLIALKFDGAEGLRVDEGGNLEITVQGEKILWTRPYVYQDDGGKRREVAGRFVLKDSDMVAFHVTDYDRNQHLVIDPIMVYSTYLGGNDYESAQGIATDSSGNIYVAGETFSTNFPTVNAIKSGPAEDDDVFVAKLNPAGTALLYSTYVGGGEADFAKAIAVDDNGNVYVTGWTRSTTFPVSANAYQSTNAGLYDAFLLKLGPQGTNIMYASYLGGPYDDGGNGVALRTGGEAYLIGETLSGTNFVTTVPIQSSTMGHDPNFFQDGFVAKFNTSTNSPSQTLVYSSWFGGSDYEFATGIAVDAAGNAYLTGETYSMVDFPITNALQPSFNGGGVSGYSDAFVTKVNASGSALAFSTFLGGDGEDRSLAIALGADGRIYVSGETSSPDYPVTNALQSVIGGGGVLFTTDAFISVMDSSGSSLLYSTFLGGDVNESGDGIATDSAGRVYITGETLSENFPVTSNADQTNYASGGGDGFVAVINPSVAGATGLVYSSFVGGSDRDQAYAIAVDPVGGFYVAGATYSTNLVKYAGAYPTNRGDSDAFVFKYALPITTPISLNIARSNSFVILRWPTNSTGFVLQATTNLPSSNSWNNVADTPIINAGNYVVSQQITGTATFYRLLKP